MLHAMQQLHQTERSQARADISELALGSRIDSSFTRKDG